MAFIKKIIALFYMLLMVAVGALLVLIASGAVPAEEWSAMVDQVAVSAAFQITLASVGGILIATGVIIPMRVARKVRQNRQIKFQNPDGEVTISIAAIEEYIYKIAKDIAGISNVKSHVSYNRRGINITSEVTITAGSNIPKITEEIQAEIKNKVRTMLGVEEPINMMMRINRISGRAPFSEEPLSGGSVEDRAVPFR